MSRPPGLTATSHVVLGLLCLRSWTGYELVKQVKRGWDDVWPRAGRGIYQEPTKLVARGLASAEHCPSGNRPRTVYHITDQGRDAFQAWLTQPPGPPTFESEALLRVLFGEQGSKAQLLAAIDSIRCHARERSGALSALGADYLADGGPFPERVHVLHLAGGFLGEQFAAMLRWADWAEAHVDTWSGVSSKDVPQLDALGAEVRDRFLANIGPPPGEPPAERTR